jgi:hypothetical protein
MKHLKPFNKFINETRESDLEALADLGLGPSQLEWEVEYDEDTESMERSDKQKMYDYESPTGAHITKVEGVIEAFQTQLDIYFSNEDKIQMHIKFSQHPGDKGRAAFQVKHNSKWHSVFNPIVSSDKAEEWLQKCEDSGSSVQPIFYYYEEFLKALPNYQSYWTMENEGLNITTNEMMKPDYTRLQLFIRALRDLPIDSNIILKIRQLINNLIIDPYHNRLSILTEVDRGFSDIPGISELVAKFSRPLNESDQTDDSDLDSDLDALADLGLIDAREADIRRIIRISKSTDWPIAKITKVDMGEQEDDEEFFYDIHGPAFTNHEVEWNLLTIGFLPDGRVSFYFDGQPQGLPAHHTAEEIDDMYPDEPVYIDGSVLTSRDWQDLCDNIIKNNSYEN